MKELNELQFPDNVKYDVEHEWVSKTAPYRIGVSDFAQDQLGDLTFVELPEVGTTFAKGDEFGTLESTKSVSPLFCPVAGKVVAVNEALSDDPSLPNSDPYGQGWIIEIEPEDASQIDALMDAASYKAHLEQEGH